MCEEDKEPANSRYSRAALSTSLLRMRTLLVGSHPFRCSSRRVDLAAFHVWLKTRRGECVSTPTTDNEDHWGHELI